MMAGEQLNEVLAQTWISLQYAHARNEKTDGLISAHELLDRICEQDPERCLAVVLQILELDGSEFIAANVGAGPIEDLLVRHGPTMIDRLEQLAATNHSFSVALSGVWRSTIDSEVWQRIVALRFAKH